MTKSTAGIGGFVFGIAIAIVFSTALAAGPGLSSGEKTGLCRRILRGVYQKIFGEPKSELQREFERFGLDWGAEVRAYLKTELPTITLKSSDPRVVLALQKFDSRRFEVNSLIPTNEADLGSIWVVDRKSGNQVGQCLFRFSRNRAGHIDLYISDIRVAEDVRKQGISRAMLATILFERPDIFTVTGAYTNTNRDAANEFYGTHSDQPTYLGMPAYKALRFLGYGKIVWWDPYPEGGGRLTTEKDVSGSSLQSSD